MDSSAKRRDSLIFRFLPDNMTLQTSTELTQRWFTPLTSVVQASTSRPRFLSGIKNITVAQGREATLECHIENLGKNKSVDEAKQAANVYFSVRFCTANTVQRCVLWRGSRWTQRPCSRTTGTLSSVSRDCGSATTTSATGKLHIRNVQPSDKGFYMCQINTEPMITEVGFLDVLVPPSILDEETSSDVTVDEGSRVSLRCRASGYPPATILWRREDGREVNLERYSGRKNSVMTVEGEFLNISQVNREDMGAYLCIAKNGVPPSSGPRSESRSSWWAPRLAHRCSSSAWLEASPRPLTAWIRGDDQILLRSKKYAISEEVDSYRIRMRLQIHDLRQSDYGRYKCHAKNTFGEKEGFIRLHAKVSGRDDLQRLRAQADLSITATKSFLDENAQDSPQPGHLRFVQKRPKLPLLLVSAAALEHRTVLRVSVAAVSKERPEENVQRVNASQR
ncbi:hypothetical protein MTO96_004242 [Rhipicephalus appendiculatus]